MNETFKIMDQICCKNCAEQFLSAQKDISAEMVQPNYDPTICMKCETDFGDVQLETLAGIPTCDNCIAFFKNRPFPAWIKASFAASIALVILCFVLNFRFITAYIQVRKSAKALMRADFEQAAELMDSASMNVPEQAELREFASYYKGIFLLMEGKENEALPLLKSFQRKYGDMLNVDYFITQAQIGIAFDNKDYDRFLSLALDIKKKLPNDSFSSAVVASAYACKYATTTEEKFRIKALEALEAARAGAGQDPSFKEYEQRILHRITTREIITKEEFEKKYPNGW